MMKQKRNQKRYIKRFMVEFTGGISSEKGISSDFSLEGFFVRTTHPLPAGTVCDVWIYLGAGKIVHVSGEVVRSAKAPSRWYAGKKMKLTTEKEGMAIKILHRDEHYLHLIRDLLPT